MNLKITGPLKATAAMLAIVSGFMYTTVVSAEQDEMVVADARVPVVLH